MGKEEKAEERAENEGRKGGKERKYVGKVMKENV